jgi:LCP family protein required for cell wall assembly
MSPDKDKDKDRPTGEGDEQQDEGGLTEEFEAQFGEDFGADVADEMAIEDAEDEEEEDAEDEEEEDAEAEAGGGELDEDDDDLDGEDQDEDDLDDEDEAAAERDPLEVLSEETVEADVLALADEEEEREQAEREAAAALEAGSATGTHEHVVQETGEGPATGESPPPTGEEDAVEDDTPPKPGLLPRFMAASLVVIIAMATATSVSILLYFTKIAKGLGGLENLQDQLVKVEPGKPQTILIMGSDRRPELEDTGRSDTTMLLRLDPDNEAIALLSLPRDLKVNIPGRGIAKLNEAYTLGGPELTTEVVQNLTGLEINHAVNVDFEGFEKAINAIDCVYVDVDRQYFHSNEGLASTELFSEIDIQAGYQLLCGDRALQYVRYRHTDNDIVRSARQQDFLREARQKIGPARLFRDREELIEIFTDYTTSDIDDPFVLSEVVKLFLASADAPIKQVHFEGELGTAYVTASSDQIKTAVDQFLGIKDTPGGLADEGGGGNKKPKPDKPKKEPKDQKPVAPALIDVTGAGLAYAEKYAPAVGFPVEYPTKLVPGSQIISESREYKIADEDKDIHRAYKLVFSIPGTSVPLEFYGLMGTTWLDPPILDNPSETRTIGGREYNLFFDGDRLRMLGWRTDEAAYWLSNTLLQRLDEDEMIAIADSMAEVSPPKKKKKK